jgi:hypothetical protein
MSQSSSTPCSTPGIPIVSRHFIGMVVDSVSQLGAFWVSWGHPCNSASHSNSIDIVVFRPKITANCRSRDSRRPSQTLTPTDVSSSKFDELNFPNEFERVGKRVGIDDMTRKVDLLFWTRNDIRSMKRGTGLANYIA